MNAVVELRSGREVDNAHPPSSSIAGAATQRAVTVSHTNPFAQSSVLRQVSRQAPSAASQA